MAAGSDVREILELDSGRTEDREFVTKDDLFGDKKKLKNKKIDANVRRPEGMHRELWGLLWTDNKDAPPIMPIESNQGYKQMKAKIGQSRVRSWKWMPFTNPARKDGAVFYHWRRAADEGKDYPFTRFNKQVEMPMYSDIEYQQHLNDDNWSRQETDYLYEQCRRFDLRFIVVQDRWDRERFPNRSVEDLKERYYHIRNTLIKVRAASVQETKIRAYDADHERRRKEQLEKLFSRTSEQVEEEEQLIQELKKIEQRKKEREKKTQDLQKLITAADSNVEKRPPEKKLPLKKKTSLFIHKKGGIIKQQSAPEMTGIKFPDVKQAGPSLRSQRMKLPAVVGQKKIKAIEQALEELGIELCPMPTEDMVQPFNELRQDIVLLYELKLALANCEYELQTMRHRSDTIQSPAKEPPQIPPEAAWQPDPSSSVDYALDPPASPSRLQKISEPMNVTGSPDTPSKKRKAAFQQGNLLKKLKHQL